MSKMSRAGGSVNSHGLGYRDVKTRMLLGQWATNLVGLERRLLDELDQQTARTPTLPADEFGQQEKPNQPSQVGRAQASTLAEEPFSVEGSRSEIVIFKSCTSFRVSGYWRKRIPGKSAGPILQV